MHQPEVPVFVGAPPGQENRSEYYLRSRASYSVTYARMCNSRIQNFLFICGWSSFFSRSNESQVGHVLVFFISRLVKTSTSTLGFGFELHETPNVFVCLSSHAKQAA